MEYLITAAIIVIIIIILLAIYNNKIKTPVTPHSTTIIINLIAAITIIITIILCANIYSNNRINDIKTNINEKYGIQLEETNKEKIKLSDYDKNQLIGPIKGQYTNSNRIYDIYIKKEANGTTNQLYIKNEKGAYIPITEMTATLEQQQ